MCISKQLNWIISEVQVSENIFFNFSFFCFKTASSSPGKWNCHLLSFFTFIFSLGQCVVCIITKKYFNYFAGSDQYRPPRSQNPRPQKRLAFPILRNVNNYFKSLSRTFKRRLRRQRRVRKRVRRDYQKAYRTHLVEVTSFERRYGFRCKITLVDKQQCQLGVSCDSEGNRLSERIIKRQSGEEFLATGPPECRTELSPLGCTPAVQN